MPASPEQALRPIRAAADAVLRLRAERAPPAEAFLRVVDAVDATLRRLLRDAPGAQMELRLRALDAEELPSDELIAELRRTDRVSLEYAAAFHALLAARAAVRAGAQPTAEDAALAVRVAEDADTQAKRPAPVPAPPADPDPTLAAPSVPVPVRTPRRRRSPVFLIGGLLTVLAVVAAILWWRGGRGESADFAEGVVRFRSGDLRGAEERMRRVAEARPEDPTPRLFLARIRRRGGDPEGAIRELRIGLAASPRDAGLHRELGFLLLEAGEAESATERFRTAIALEPDAAEGWMGLVRSLRAAGRPDAAERVIARAPPGVRSLLQRTPSPSR